MKLWHEPNNEEPFIFMHPTLYHPTVYRKMWKNKIVKVRFTIEEITNEKST